MNSGRSASWSNSLLSLALLLSLISCNPYHKTIREASGEEQAKALISLLQTSYPFSGHKGIDWKEYDTELTPLLSNKFSDSIYHEVRSFFYRIPDARMNIRRKNDPILMNQYLSGYAGFDLLRFPDGSCRVISVDSSGQAFLKGLRPGDQILGWNGSNIHQVIQESVTPWGMHPASLVTRELLQDYFMTRGPVNQSVELFYENATGNTKGIRVEFTEKATSPVPDYLGIPGFSEDYPEFLITEDIGIWTLTDFSHKTLNLFTSTIRPALENIKGLVIDLRNNRGGHDDVAARIAGYFVQEESVYEETVIWDPKTDGWLNIGSIHIHPQDTIQFSKSVYMVIGPLCNGAGEGFARVMSNEANISTIGLWNTAGSFSYPGGKVKIPNKFTLYYPVGMSVDENGSILLESPGDYGGGIYPDIRIPFSYEVMQALGNGQDVLLYEALRHAALQAN